VLKCVKIVKFFKIVKFVKFVEKYIVANPKHKHRKLFDNFRLNYFKIGEKYCLHKMGRS
jgi:hypothetical protein